jgi:hypothetical protein
MPTKLQLQNQLSEQQQQISRVSKLYQNVMQQNSYLASRRGLAAALGQSFDGDRDLYLSFGYKKDLVFADYLNFYERDGLATRIVDAVSDETWRKHPILTESKNETPDEENPSPLQIKFEDMADRLDLWSKFNEVDAACGISRFGLLFLGLTMKNGEQLSDPVSDKKELAYVSVHDEGDTTIDELNLVTDIGSPRFGMPEFYNIEIGATGLQQRVHYSRVIHVKEGKERSPYGRFYGVPRLKGVINRLYDLEKVVGGGSEAFWLLIYRGIALLAREGYNIPPEDSDDYKKMQENATEFTHNMRRFLPLRGMDIQDMSGKPVDSREQFDVIVAYLAGSTRIPQRLLIGSEAGKLASSQDDANWLDYISWRKENHAEPYILRPFLRKMADLGQVEHRDRYFSYWPSGFQLNDLEEADVALKIAQAINTAGGGAPESVMPPTVYSEKLPDKWKYIWTPEKLAEMAEQNEPEIEDSDEDFGGPEEINLGKNGNGKFSANKLDLVKMRQVLTENSENKKLEVESEEVK